jgi:hypothetical protein
MAVPPLSKLNIKNSCIQKGNFYSCIILRNGYYGQETFVDQFDYGTKNRLQSHSKDGLEALNDSKIKEAGCI